MKVRQVRGKAYTPWEVAVPASITGTRRVRKYFATRAEADAYLVRVRTQGFTHAEHRAESGKEIFLALCLTLPYICLPMKRTSRKTLSLPKEMIKAIQLEADRNRRSFSSMTNEILREALRLEVSDTSKRSK